jgi:4-amino-4-deoxychorismate lyase
MIAKYNGHGARGDWVWSRGLHYGDGVFRTALILDSRIVDLDRQADKLLADAQSIGLAASAARACVDDARRIARGCDRGVVKMILWRKAEGRGYRPATSAAERLVLRSDLPDFRSASWTKGIAAVRSPIVLAAQPRLAGLKHLSRLEQVLASDGWPQGVDEAIQCDASGRPISGTRTNLFWVRRGVLYTPDLSQCGVAGVMREKVLETAQTLGVRWRISAGDWRNLADSEEAFVTNSLIGIWPLRRCDALRWVAPGRITRALSESLAHPLRGLA